MIERKSGDIIRDDAEALVNTVNCVGIMGRGIALQFKKAFPENFAAYAAACRAERVQPGRMFVYQSDKLTHPRWIINFPTKRHWRGKSRIEDIDSGLIDLVRVLREKKVSSVAIPPLGSGLGGLDWLEVRPRIEKALAQLPEVHVTIYEPGAAPTAEPANRGRAVPRMTAGRAALVELTRRYLDGLLEPFVTLLEVHKLMYFMQEAGEPLKLRYQAALYGPYAENLRHVLHEIEGQLISGYSDGGDAPDKQLQLVPGAAAEAAAFLEAHPESRSRFERVTDLVEGFESPSGLELLATVHWVMSGSAALPKDKVVERVYAWNERKRRFTPRQIELARRVLASKGWVERVNDNTPQ